MSPDSPDNHPRNHHFPHLLPPDAAVWNRFLSVHADKYLSFEYDLRVGKGRDPGAAFTTNIRSMALQLSQRRIDAIGHKRDSVTIFEITRKAGLTALGQLQAYPVLYRELFPGDYPLHTILVAESLQDDILQVLRATNTAFLLFPPT